MPPSRTDCFASLSYATGLVRTPGFLFYAICEMGKATGYYPQVFEAELYASTFGGLCWKDTLKSAAYILVITAI